MKNKSINILILTLTGIICVFLVYRFFDNSDRNEWFSISVVMTFLIPVYLGFYLLILATIGLILRRAKKVMISKAILKSTFQSLIMLGLCYVFLISKQQIDFKKWKKNSDLKAIENNKKDSVAYQNKLDSLSFLINKNPENYKELFERGLLKRTKGYYYESIEDYEKALSINPNDFKTNLECGYSYSLINDSINCDKYYQKAVQIKPNSNFAKRRARLLNEK